MRVLIEVGEDLAGIMRPVGSSETVNLRAWATAMARRPNAYWGQSADGAHYPKLVAPVEFKAWPGVLVIEALGYADEGVAWVLAEVPDGTLSISDVSGPITDPERPSGWFAIDMADEGELP